MSHGSKQALCIHNAGGLDPVARELHALLHKQGTLALHLGCMQSLQASSSASLERSSGRSHCIDHHCLRMKNHWNLIKIVEGSSDAHPVAIKAAQLKISGHNSVAGHLWGERIAPESLQSQSPMDAR